MNVICKVCGAYINSFDKECPNCGVANEVEKENSNKQNNNINYFKNFENDNIEIKTIEELKKWYASQKFPSEDISRFFIGINYIKPNAFGIYEDFKTKNYIVYQNKNNGEKNILYDGEDEKYAVNIIYTQLKIQANNIRLKSQKIEEEKRKNKVENNISTNNIKERYYIDRELKDKNGKILKIFVIILIIFISTISIITYNGVYPHKGYYDYEECYYYYQNNNWYIYNNSNDWNICSNPPKELTLNSKNYYISKSYKSSYNIQNFKHTKYYINLIDAMFDSDDENNSGGFFIYDGYNDNL